MPADPPHIGTGRRRQSRSTEPDRPDDRRKALDREIAREATVADEDVRRHSGAHTPAGPHRIVEPGTRRDIEEANPDEEVVDRSRDDDLKQFDN